MVLYSMMDKSMWLFPESGSGVAMLAGHPVFEGSCGRPMIGSRDCNNLLHVMRNAVTKRRNTYDNMFNHFASFLLEESPGEGGGEYPEWKLWGKAHLESELWRGEEEHVRLL